MLGLYNPHGLLEPVGFTSTNVNDEPVLTRSFALCRVPPELRGPGASSRWSTKGSGEWAPLRPELVVEVLYDHVTGTGSATQPG